MSQIESINFEYLKSQDVLKHSNFQITNPNLYDESGGLQVDGPLDSRFGVDSVNEICVTCDKKGGSCLGHQGHINLAMPIIQPGLRNYFKEFFKGVCMSCKRYDPKKICPSCNNQLKYTFPTPYIVKDLQTGQTVGMKSIYAVFQQIPFNDYATFFKSIKIKPVDLFMTKLIVPSITVRPNIRLEGNMMVDDLSRKLKVIVSLNQKLKKHIATGYLDLITEQIYNLLCYQIYTYLDNKISSLPVSTIKGGKVIKSLLQRIESKEGLLRATLRGKRTNFAARCVITSDPNLKISEVGIPLSLAKSMTRPVSVSKYNMDQIRQWVSSKGYVGVTYYDHRLPSGQFVKLKVNQNNRQLILEKLQCGDIVHRHLITGDYVVLNRAPTIHRYGLMGHQVVVYDNEKESHTIRINPTICLPYNADFDGDQMHLHAPQKQSAQIDIQLFMSVDKNYTDSKNGFPIVGIQNELLTAAFVLSRDNPTFTRAEAIQLMGPHFIDRQLSNYSGRDLISMCLMAGFNFQGSGLVIRDGVFIQGVLNKANFSRTSKFSENLMIFSGVNYKQIFQKFIQLFRSYSKHLDHSVNLFDYRLDDQTKNDLKSLKEEYYQKCAENLQETYSMSKAYQLKAFTLVQDKYQRDKLTKNPANIMALAGSSGSLINLVQMSNMIGQRLVRGVSPAEYFVNLYPSLSGDLVKAYMYKHGIVWGNYSNGLSYLDFLNDAIHARDANLTNQLKITNMGYFSRRLMCALSDLYVDKQSKIVDSKGRIIQYRFGGSGVDTEDYKPTVKQPILTQRLRTGYFKQEGESNIKLSELKEYLSKRGYDDVIYQIIKVNAPEDAIFSERQIDLICKSLFVPWGTPIGMATGHSITQPSQQMTLSAKHKLTGSQTTLQRLVHLIDRALVAPQVHLQGQAEQLDKLSKEILPVTLADLGKIIVDIQKSNISIQGELSQDLVRVLTQYLDSQILQKYELKHEKDLCSITLSEELQIKELYKIAQFTKNYIIRGSKVIKNHTMVGEDTLILQGLKNTIQLYKYIETLKTQGKLQKIKVKYLDPVYIYQRAGIEAARKALYQQLAEFLKEGITIDPRYISLFCDLMAYVGKLVALNRSGVITLKSPLTRSSFEATKSIVYKLALTQEKDNLKSPLSCIMVGKLIPICSNYFTVQF